MIFAQVYGSYSIGQLAIMVVIVLAVFGLVWVFVRQSGVPVPPWLGQVIGIVFAAVVIIIAIKLVLSL